MRDFKEEHARRQRSKKRMIFEVDRTEYDKLTPEQQKTLSEKVRQLIKNYLKRPK